MKGGLFSFLGGSLTGQRHRLLLEGTGEENFAGNGTFKVLCQVRRCQQSTNKRARSPLGPPPNFRFLLLFWCVAQPWSSDPLPLTASRHWHPAASGRDANLYKTADISQVRHWNIPDHQTVKMLRRQCSKCKSRCSYRRPFWTSSDVQD